MSTQNIDVSLANRNVDSAKADVLSANRAPLPTLTAKTSSIDLQNGTGTGSLWQEQRIDKSVGLDWTYERGQKRALRTQSSEKSVDANLAELKATRINQQLLAANAFFDLLASQQKSSEVQSIAASYGQLEKVAATRLSAGDISAQEHARIAIEARRAMADAMSAELENRRASIALSSVLGIQAGRDRLMLTDAWPSLANSPSPSEALGAQGIDQLPEVQAAQDRLAAAEVSLQLAQSLKKSDITFGSSIDHFPGTSDRLLEFRLQMPLQWGYGFEGEIAKALTQVDQARDQLEKIRLLASAERLGLSHALETAKQRLNAYETVIYPQAQQVASQAELAYQKGAMSLTDLLDARRTLRTILIERTTAKAEHAKSIAALNIRYPNSPR
jgi:cobalt-zinc-cadmium efflux system outer membrane protein